MIREIAKYRDDPGAPKLQSLIHEFGTGLRDKHNRADLSRTSSTIKWLLDCLISKRLSSECELQLYRVLANFVSDLPNNRTFLLNDYKDCKTFFEWTFNRLNQHHDIDSQLALYICVFVYNFIISETQEHQPALYIDRFQFQSSQGTKTTPWNTFIDILKQVNDESIMELLLNIMDALSDIREENECFKQLDTDSLSDLLNVFTREMQNENRDLAHSTLSILENVLNNKKLQLENTQVLTTNLINEMKLFSEEDILTSLFNSVVLVSTVKTTSESDLSTYISIWQDSKSNNLVKALALILISNTIVSDSSKSALMARSEVHSIFDAFFQNDYDSFSDDNTFKHLELQSTVLMNKLITDRIVLQWLNIDLLNNFLRILSETCKETQFNSIFKNILLLNLKFLQRLFVSYQMHVEVSVPNDLYKCILSFSLDSGLFGTSSVDVALEREIDVINFTLIACAVLKKDSLDFLQTPDSIFETAQKRMSEQAGPIPFEYLMEATKGVALCISQNSKLIGKKWFAEFFRVLNLAVNQKEKIPALINNYKFICGVVLKADTASSKELVKKYTLL